MKSQENVIVREPNGNRTAISPQDLTDLPIAQYYQMADNFVNVQSAIYYDTASYTAGTAITAAMRKQLFTKGKNQEDTVVNTAAAIAEKGDYQTNMITDGEFEGGTTFILEQIAVNAQLTSELPTTLGARGEITAPNYTASVVISAANNLKAYLEQMNLEYYRNEEKKLGYPLYMWPSPFGMTGAIGSPNAGVLQNNGFGIRLARPVVFNSEDRFSFHVVPTVPTFTPTMGIRIQVLLIGKTIKTFQP